MNLNLPLIPALLEARSVLIAGMGGGFDIFCGLPIRYTLQQAGKTVHLANLSFTSLKFICGTVSIAPGVYGVHPDCQTVLQYVPELYLTRYLQEREGVATTVWCLGKMEMAVQPLLRAYEALIAYLKPDLILLIDGGVDSLIRGDEVDVGTVFEDIVSLAALSQLSSTLPIVLACLGMGAEDDITYAQVLENIATLAKDAGVFGTCSLTAQMDAYRIYEGAVSYTHSQRMQQPSVIQSSVVSAVQGHFGNYHATERTKKSKLHISPLMALYWFFDLQAVAKQCLLVTPLIPSETRREALNTIASVRMNAPKRPLIPRIL